MKNEPIKYIVIIVILFYVISKIEKIFSIFSPPENSSQASESYQDLPVNKQNLTFPKQNYELLADAIYDAVWSQWGGFIEKDKAVRDILLMMENDDDFFQLSNTYGLRGKGVLIQEYYSLISTIANFLDNTYKTQVNEEYADKGISVRV